MNSCHNHQDCIDSALANAHKICAEKGVRLTALREKVLLLIWQNHRPLGAYDLIDMLADISKRRIAPPTIYRTLEFLLSIGMIHRINSLNAYIGCPDPATEHPSYFLICTECQHVDEFQNSSLSQQIDQLGNERQFDIQAQWLEIMGLCDSCQQKASRLDS